MLAFSRAVEDPATGISERELFLRRADGSISRLTNHPSADFAPSWSPDATRIAFTSRRSGNDDIWVLNIVNGDLQQLTSSPQHDVGPAWSPDGTQIAYSSNPNGLMDIYLLSLATRSRTRLYPASATDPVSDIGPTWAPDGSALAWSRQVDGSFWDIMMMSPVEPGTEPIPFIATPEVSELGPKFSPDGERLLYESDLTENFDIWVTGASDSSTRTNLTSASTAFDAMADWQPVPEFPLVDARFSIFFADIRWLFDAGITGGCSSERYCPTSPVTRGQMAAFLDRALDLPPATMDHFGDDDTSPFEDSINRLAEAGITGGCAANAFCPKSVVNRGQMAAFLRRGLEP